MTEPVSLLLFAPAHCGPLLADEIRALGLEVEAASGRQVWARTDLDGAYRLALECRIATRLLTPLLDCDATSDEGLYAAVGDWPWEHELAADGRLAVDFRGTGGWLNHSGHGARRIKDAICDRFVADGGTRPSVDLDRPDLRLHVFYRDGRAQLFRDLGGGPLHERGYRVRSTGAPMKENLAAALLLAAGWPAMARESAAFCDPMCGSGTLLIEAAMMAAGIPAGTLRRHWGFRGWSRHEPARWQSLRDGARRHAAEAVPPVPITGSDIDPAAVNATVANVAAAGLEDHVRIARRPVHRARPPAASLSPMSAQEIESAERPWGSWHVLDEGELVGTYER
jgi:23S rRNA (guanine2445-N2)-methyltransferase / 23S rRNA (guanine2069-N7)-methyltransferase